MSADPSAHPPLRLATRGSALALVQSRIVADGLRAAWPELRVELVTVVTEGDKRRDVPAAALGGKGIFTGAVQEAVLEGRADLAVHSAKDLPAAQVPGLVLAAVPPRDDPRDALVGRQPLSGLDDLAPGARVGTGSPRRVALLNWLRPDLELAPIRGNVDSRVRRVHAGELDAVVLAVAGLRRLGLGGEGAVPLDPEAFPPAPGQGTLAVEARQDDTRALGLLSALTHRPSRVALRAERAFLQRLGGSCTLPAGAYLRPTDAGPLEIHGFLSALDGKGLVRERLRGPADDPEGLGRALADRLLDACGPEVRALVEDSRR
ncbi:MAG TPA: hydroxymethylbilane synthase [Actinomycetota bacterium]|jgi:hydroxymethylbilane synthase|nr:hydroxymethylbilane synthase [Actinomycetota bacterium]